MLIERTQTARVVHLALNRPQKRNALNQALCHELVQALEAADADGSIGAIVLSGNGSAFCAGMDLTAPADPDLPVVEILHERLFTVVNRLGKPLIAAVHGPALAGGTGLVANAHIVIAAPGAAFGLTEIRIGLWPVLVFRACRLAMGERRTTELSITGRTFTGEQALSYGLASELAENPLARALEMAVVVSEYSPNAMKAGLDSVHQTRDLGWDEAGRVGQKVRRQLMEHADYAEGVRAFREKVRP